MNAHPDQARRPLRVLHIAFTMHARGTETWLVNLLRRTDRSRVRMDFLTVEGERGLYDEDIRRLGGRVLPCPSPERKGAFLRGLRFILEKEGPYDIVHAHPFALSGLVLMQAARCGVPVRIAHSHTDRRQVREDRSLVRKMYMKLMRMLLNRYATAGLAAGEDAAQALFGPRWESDPRWSVMHCGIDLDPFRHADGGAVRQQLGLPPDVKIIGHVGSFHPEKNHDFLIGVFENLLKRRDKIHLLLVGDGPLRAAMEGRVREAGLDGQVTFAGVRQDIPALLSIMDVFVFPSLFEGMGLALIEAQAAGLPCVAAESVPADAAVVPGAVTFLPLLDSSLTEDPEIWAAAVSDCLDRGRVEGALFALEPSGFNLEKNVSDMTALYERLVRESAV